MSYHEVDLIKEILKILENTVIQLTGLIKEIKNKDMENKAYYVDLKEKKK